MVSYSSEEAFDMIPGVADIAGEIRYAKKSLRTTWHIEIEDLQEHAAVLFHFRSSDEGFPRQLRPTAAGRHTQVTLLLGVVPNLWFFPSLARGSHRA
jgi:hypothetical protein